MTTSPLQTPRDDGEFTPVSGDGKAPASIAVPATIRAEWARYRRFLRTPHLIPGGPQMPGALAATGRMLVLDMAFMAVFVAGLGIASAAGFEPPANVNNTLEPGLLTIIFVVVAAPILEEIVFRSWLSGRAAIIAFVLLALLGLGVLPLVASGFETNAMKLGVGGLGLAIGFILAPLAAFLLLRRPVSPVFARFFPWLFWASTVAFALIHLGNYTNASWAMLGILLPLILPQFALGTMLGYLRVHYGLVPAIALHASHNGILFGLAIAGGLGGDAGEAAATLLR